MMCLVGEVEAWNREINEQNLLKEYSRYVVKGKAGYKVHAENGKVTVLKNSPGNGDGIGREGLVRFCFYLHSF